ncbi:MAG TPA: sugar ABC transporter [Planctomycetaceae bacterium]|nr:sugar ABC transporter [Planctomycetaceae bacterium]
MPSLLGMSGIGKRFGATQALEGVSFALTAGRVMALIGENGAGKSTLMKVLSGACQADSGTMQVDGVPYRPTGPSSARDAGIAMIYQELNLAPDLSVEDNIMLGQEESRNGLLNRKQQRPRVREVLDRLGHPELQLDTPVGQLSVGAQQLVEIARALIGNARVIVFDEPTSSLTGQDVRQLFEVIKRLRNDGIGVVYISHFLEEVRELCDDYTVLRDGQVAGDGVLEGTTESEIVSMMVGRQVEELFPTVAHTAGAPILDLESLSGRQIPRDIDLVLHRGEILGIAGLVGAGRTEMLRCLFGLDPVVSGTVRVGGVVRTPRPRAMIQAGLALVSEDRKDEGLAQDRSLSDNITYSHLAPYSRMGWLNLRDRHDAVTECMTELEIKAVSPEQAVQELSGGNQQKVALARVLHQDADVLLLDEPTRGIDVGTKAEVYRLVGEQAAAGKAILFVSSYTPELLAICDRVAVLARGRLQEIRSASDWTEESLINCAIGGEATVV